MSFTSDVTLAWVLLGWLLFASTGWMMLSRNIEWSKRHDENIVPRTVFAAVSTSRFAMRKHMVEGTREDLCWCVKHWIIWFGNPSLSFSFNAEKVRAAFLVGLDAGYIVAKKC